MEFITEEIKTELGLAPEVIEKIKPLYEGHLANLKSEWDKKANENAEGILTGATKKFMEVSGVKEERKAGEKFADYYARVLPLATQAEREKVTALETEYQNKLKDFKGGDALQAEVTEAKKKLDSALQKYADYDTLKEKADKYEPLNEQYTNMQKEVCFSYAKPTFPETANQFEVEAKWNSAKADVLKEWDVVFKDGKAIAVNKENQYLVEDLKNLILKNEEIKGLLDVKKPQGTGSKPASKKKIEGVPFEVPAELDVKERVELIRAQCAKEGLISTTDEYSKRFAELNEKLTQKTA